MELNPVKSLASKSLHESSVLGFEFLHFFEIVFLFGGFGFGVGLELANAIVGSRFWLQLGG
ncbi:hypothetical protein RchiOBHm_Chr6g0296371 [Rosa chinensis]|uniref:Uncharacterized protein n=1 Tax=Rosa chinensis TaxID=74649 RepID=A0A2P6PXE7_ROSCH|nr:hypothetical protein RchiOBHm_Chr6g0296371 [Rosa chinensis]